MPSISEILDSIQVPTLIKDPLITLGNFARNARGLQYYSGGFTVVFPVSVMGDKWAFRCWHSDLGNVRNRFKIISDYINQLNSPYFCDFHYCDEGIVVDGKIYPTTRMKWVDGKTLNQYILDNISNPDCLLALASEFITMIDFLHDKKIAHGDLQHGNILVQNGKIKLVDYDSIFVPGLEKSSDIIIGKEDFQHPKRKNLKIASAKLDYFSELVIYLSIIAIAKDPSLVNKYSIDDSLLFHASDWIDFKNSKIYADLINKDNDITLLLHILEEYLKQEDIDQLEPFTNIWKKRLKKPVIKSFICGNVKGIVFKEDETEIVWDVENFTEQFIDNIPIPNDFRSQKRVFFNDIDIKLTLHNGLHIISETRSVKVVDKPIINFSSHKTKLKKKNNEIEQTTLDWTVSNALSVSLKCGTEILSTSTSASAFKIIPQKDSTYELIAVGLDGETEFISSIKIIVRETANVIFEADKSFTLPGVPITLSWLTTNAESVDLDGTKVPNKGKCVYKPDNDTKYCLTVEDIFGRNDHFVEIRMLPLPFVKSILIDTPNIDKTLSIHYKTPHFEKIHEIPSFEADFAKLDAPTIPDLKQEGLFIELPKTPRKKLSQLLSKFVINLFNKHLYEK